MKNLIKILSFIFISTIIVTSCQDVDIENFNDPDLASTLTNADDYPGTLAGAYLAWWNALHKDNPYMTLSVAADHGTSSWGNFNMREVGTLNYPDSLDFHNALNNTQSAPSTAYLTTPWYSLYEAISTANDILKGIRIDKNLVQGNEAVTGVTEFQAVFIRGVSKGYIGLLFDQGFIVNEDTDLETVTPEALVPYTDMSASAISDLQAALDIATANGAVSISQFNGLDLSHSQSVALVNSFMAKFWAQTPRTAAEAANVNWGNVLTAAQNGIDYDFAPQGDGGTNWWHAYFRHGNPGWMRLDQKIVNMIDTTQPDFYPAESYTVDSLVLAGIPDTRLGDAGSGAYFTFAGAAPFRPDRGTYFFSQFKIDKHNSYRTNLSGPMLSFPEEENDLYLAEALVRTGGDLQKAVDIINSTRVDIGGLSAATITDTDLMDKIFYERYLEAYEGPGSPFFDRRRTDDLGDAQFLHFPIPALELNTLGVPLYTFGGK